MPVNIDILDLRSVCRQGYEKRYYPAATFVCNKTSVDTAADPLAGLDDMNPFVLMSSKRYQRHHQSQMFMELFRYISGVNKVALDTISML